MKIELNISEIKDLIIILEKRFTSLKLDNDLYRRLQSIKDNLEDSFEKQP